MNIIHGIIASPRTTKDPLCSQFPCLAVSYGGWDGRMGSASSAHRIWIRMVIWPYSRSPRRARSVASVHRARADMGMQSDSSIYVIGETIIAIHYSWRRKAPSPSYMKQHICYEGRKGGSRKERTETVYYWARAQDVSQEMGGS